jgi:hypothetical protein
MWSWIRPTPADTATTTDRRLREQSQDARAFGIALGPANQDVPGLAKPLAGLHLVADLTHLDIEHREGVLDERDVQVFLRAEVQVDRTDGELRRARDQLDRRAGVAALRKHRPSRLLDATAAGLPLLRLAFLSVRHVRSCSHDDASGQAGCLWQLIANRFVRLAPECASPLNLSRISTTGDFLR